MRCKNRVPGVRVGPRKAYRSSTQSALASPCCGVKVMPRYSCLAHASATGNTKYLVLIVCATYGLKILWLGFPRRSCVAIFRSDTRTYPYASCFASIQEVLHSGTRGNDTTFSGPSIASHVICLDTFYPSCCAGLLPGSLSSSSSILIAQSLTDKPLPGSVVLR